MGFWNRKKATKPVDGSQTRKTDQPQNEQQEQSQEVAIISMPEGSEQQLI
jgi:hypothetical protein